MMREAILALLEDSAERSANPVSGHGPGQTFIALSEQVPRFLGSECIAAPKFPSLILWDGISREAIKVLRAMRREKLFHYRLAPASRYALEGRLVPLPQAEAFEKYVGRRWLPVTLHLGPDPALRSKLATTDWGSTASAGS
jgi:hypothetical protein